jgi:hypothetical protein
MAGVKLPQNQLDALPLISAADLIGQVVDPGQVSIVGGSVVRWWSPIALGLKDVNFVDDPDHAGANTRLLTPFLDLSGMQQFILVVNRRCLAAGGDAGDTIGVYIQSNDGQTCGGAVGENPTGVGAGFGSSFTDGVCAFQFVVRGGPYPQNTLVTAKTGWVNGIAGLGPTFPQMAGRARVWLQGPAVPNANQLYTISLWAQS